MAENKQCKDVEETPLDFISQEELYKVLINYSKIKQIVEEELSPLSLDEMSNAEIKIREIFEQE